MDSKRTNDLYELRDVDEQLRAAAIEWLKPNSRLRWISLRSKSSNGNTWLMKQFRDWLRDSQVRFNDVLPVFVKGGDTYHPKLVGPLSLELAQLKRASQRTRLQQIAHRLRSAPFRRKLFGIMLLLFFVVLGALWIGFSEYNKSADAPWSDLATWTKGFFKFLLANWHKLPMWLFTEASLGVLLSFAFSSIILYLSQGRLFPRPQQERVSRKELRALRSDKHLAEALNEITRNHDGLILLIDDAQSLPEYEKQLLRDLADPVEERPELKAFSEKCRILVVTLEVSEVAWKELPDKAALVLNVPRFTLDQLSAIARKQMKKSFESLRESDQNDLLQRAQENINLLFAQRTEAYDRAIGQAFENARDEGISGVFDQADLMAYWAVAHAHSVEKQELMGWLESPEFRLHLKEFGLRHPSDPQQVAKHFGTSELVRRQGQTYFFKLPQCQSLQRWLIEHSDETRRLLARAHYFWFRSLLADAGQSLTNPSLAIQMPADEQLAIKEATWHAIQVGKYLNNPADVLEDAVGLSQAERGEHCVAVASALMAAAVFRRSEGDTIEASDPVVDAIKWLNDMSDPLQRQWVERGVEQLWLNYWLLGDASTLEQLEELANRFSWLEASQGWRVNHNYRRLLCGDIAVPPQVEESSLSAELHNLERLTMALRDIKQKYGPVPGGLRDSSIVIPKPREVAGKSLSELCLRHLHVAALVHRGDSTRLSEELSSWRARLKETAPAEHQLGDKALQYYDEARYWHLLTDFTRISIERIEDDKDIPKSRKGQALAELFDRLNDACLVPLTDGSLPSLLQEARASYDRSLKIFALLGWCPLLMDASFHLGDLLSDHTPLSMRTQTPEPWWWYWNKLFLQTLRMEKEFGWTIHTPVIYRLRWKFFEEEEDNERSVEDAYKALQEAKRANYPLRLILAWHRQAGIQLTNHSDSNKDRRRDAELHLEWAEKLAALPEAREFWKFEALEHEQAESLHFAAQAKRFLDDLESAEQLLDKAESLVGPPPAEKKNPPDRKRGVEVEPQNLRDLRISLKLQRAWVYQAQWRKAKYYEAIQDIWSVIGFGNDACALVLKCLTDFEHESNLLGQPWPEHGLKPHADPANRKLWLPPSWYSGASTLHFENRFEFRFYQLLNTINYSANIVSLERQADLELEEMPVALNMLSRAVDGARRGDQYIAHRSGPYRLFKPELLQVVASSNWLGVNKFAEVSRSFAAYGRIYRHGPETHALIINLLDAVRFYFAEVEPVVSEEMKTLKLLILYDPSSPKNYYRHYAHLLLQQEHLMMYEHLSLEGAEGAAWYAVAQEIDDYLGILVDAELLFINMNEELRRQNISHDEFLQEKERRHEDLKKGEEEYLRGDREACLDAITPALPPQQSPWVFLEDLRILSLWLQCMPHDGVDSVEVRQREAQLRAQSRQFIAQFSIVVKDHQVQQFAVRILGAIRMLSMNPLE